MPSALIHFYKAHKDQKTQCHLHKSDTKFLGGCILSLDEDNDNDDIFQDIYDFHLLFLFCCFMLLAFYSIIFSKIRLIRKGISMDAKSAFFLKNTLYVYVLTGVWII